MDCNPPGSSVSGILQARILEWVAIPFSRRTSQPRDGPGSPALQTDSLPCEPRGKLTSCTDPLTSFIFSIYRCFIFGSASWETSSAMPSHLSSSLSFLFPHFGFSGDRPATGLSLCSNLPLSEEPPVFRAVAAREKTATRIHSSASGFHREISRFPAEVRGAAPRLAPPLQKHRWDGGAARRALWGPGLGDSPHRPMGTPQRETGRGDACPLGMPTPGSIGHQQSPSLVRRGSQL